MDRVSLVSQEPVIHAITALCPTRFQMFDWIYSNKEAFLVNYVDIGHSHSSAKKLQDEHHARTHNSNVGLQF